MHKDICLKKCNALLSQHNELFLFHEALLLNWKNQVSCKWPTEQLYSAYTVLVFTIVSVFVYTSRFEFFQHPPYLAKMIQYKNHLEFYRNFKSRLGFSDCKISNKLILIVF